MYLQITTRCNQACDHCLFGCRPGVGSHMEWDTFINSVSFMVRNDRQDFTLGGGEPTMHPRLTDMIEHILSMDNQAYIWFATNGINTKRAWELVHFAQDMNDIYHPGAVSIDLSVDYWHKYQNHDLREFFKRGKFNSTFKARDVSQRMQLINQGRAKRLGIGSDNSCCGGYTIKPWGDIRACCCKDSPLIGNVRYGDIDYDKPISPRYLKQWQKMDDQIKHWEDALSHNGCFHNMLPPEKGHRFI